MEGIGILGMFLLIIFYLGLIVLGIFFYVKFFQMVKHVKEIRNYFLSKENKTTDE